MENHKSLVVFLKVEDGIYHQHTMSCYDHYSTVADNAVLSGVVDIEWSNLYYCVIRQAQKMYKNFKSFINILSIYYSYNQCKNFVVKR